MYFLVFLRLSTKSSKNFEKTKKNKKKNKPMGWRRSGGLGCVFLFFLFFLVFLVFLRLSTKSSKNLEKTNKKKQTHGMEKIWGVGVCFFCFFCFFWFFGFFGFGRLWQTLWGAKEQMVSDFLLVCDFSLV